MQPHQQLYVVLALVSAVAGSLAGAIALGLAHLPPALVVPAIAVMIGCLGISGGLEPFWKRAFPDVPEPTPPRG